MFKKVFATSLLLLFISLSFAQKQGTGSIKGLIIEKATGNPMEFANVALKNKKDSTIAHATASDKDGKFLFSNVPFGEYVIVYSFIGFKKTESEPILLNPNQKNADLGKLYIAEIGHTLNEVTVTGRRSTYVTSIDRKTINIGQDLMSKAGSISDLMQNIPSVQVDVDGNVSLRGSDNVTIFVNGKPSTMMALNSAAALQQIPASAVEKIEIITNPSAKYKPDGTSGIINIVMKKDKGLGLNGNLTANVGNDSRYNFNALANYNPGKLNVYGSYGIRQDERVRISDITTKTYSSGALVNSSKTYTTGAARPIYNLANAGIDYQLNAHNKLSLAANYNYRFQRQHDISTYTLHNSEAVTTLDYDRARLLPETESDLEITSSFQHQFDKEGHELDITYLLSRTGEEENNYYTNTYREPYPILRYDNMFYHHKNKGSELSVEYTRPLSNKAKFESGYLLEYFNNDLNLFRDTLNLANHLWDKDFSLSNQFVRSEYTHVVYATFEKEIGKFGFLLGLRGEHTATKADLVTRDSIIRSHYIRLYPSLHLSYKLTNQHELQLNYSHRIRRPQDEELNPFPEYQDMQNLRIGNPNLKPEDIHSLEFGYQRKETSSTFTSTLYYRYNYNGITTIVTNLGNGVMQSTLENLASNQSAGLELIFSGSLGKLASLNLSSNAFYNTIDGSSLGYSNQKAIVSWSASGSIGFNLAKNTLWQVTSNYSGTRLTPQGRILPSFVMNSALKQEVFKKKASLILTVSDLFNTLKNTLVLDTPGIYRKDIRTRSSRVIYFGFMYPFGNSSKKQKEATIKYDNQI